MGPPICRETAEEISQLVNLFGHPLRPRIVAALALDGPASPTTLARQFGDCAVGDCNYHLRALEKAGIVVIARSRQVRGAHERIYRVTPRSRWPFKSHLRPLVSHLIPAAPSEFEPFLIAMPISLDARAAAEVAAVIDAARAKTARIETAARSRLEGADPADATGAVLVTGLLDE